MILYITVLSTNIQYNSAQLIALCNLLCLQQSRLEVGFCLTTCDSIAYIFLSSSPLDVKDLEVGFCLTTCDSIACIVRSSSPLDVKDLEVGFCLTSTTCDSIAYIFRSSSPLDVKDLEVGFCLTTCDSIVYIFLSSSPLDVKDLKAEERSRWRSIYLICFTTYLDTTSLTLTIIALWPYLKQVITAYSMYVCIFIDHILQT